MAHVDPNERWRLNIKAMGGPTGDPAANLITINSTTFLWTTNPTTGIIDPYPHAETASAGGPYPVEPIVVPFDPVHATGGSFWRFLSGPYAGKLVSKWSNTLSYGSITEGVTSNFDRGPGATIFSMEYPQPHAAGASLRYNAAGEMHFTLLVDDPNVALLRPKRQHYSIEFYDAAFGWREVFAGMLWDFDATDTEVVYYGIDYLALLQYAWDERFFPASPDKSEPTGSKYTEQAISDVITKQLTYSISQADSLISFLSLGTIEAMSETITIYSTMQNSLDFVVGLINSHRAGTGVMTRLSVDKNITTGKYEINVTVDPGVARDGLALEYVPGGLISGYRAIPFGTDWASRVNLISRTRDGSTVEYVEDNSAILQSEWGRIGQAPQIIESNDKNDLKRRARQAAEDASKLGRQISAGTLLGSFVPLYEYDIADKIPIAINHGAVQTKDWGSDAFGTDPSGDPSGVQALYWRITGLTWESYDDGHWITSPTLWPTGGGTTLPGGISTPDPVTPPAPLGTGVGPPSGGTPPATHYIDTTTGITYTWNDDTDSWDMDVGSNPNWGSRFGIPGRDGEDGDPFAWVGPIGTTDLPPGGTTGQILTVNGSGTAIWAHTILTGTADPSAGAGVAAPLLTLYTRNNAGTGELWFKTGAADTNWMQVT